MSSLRNSKKYFRKLKKLNGINFSIVTSSDFAKKNSKKVKWNMVLGSYLRYLRLLGFRNFAKQKIQMMIQSKILMVYLP